MKHATTLATLGLGLSLTHGVLAAPQTYAIDMNHSRIFFDVSHQDYSTMHGRFAVFGGTFRYDAENPANSSLDITIDPASIDTFHEGLNDHLRTDDFFNVAEYPEMRFVSDTVEVNGEDSFTVHGDFTMLGETNPVTFDVLLNRTGQTNDGVPKAGFTAIGTLDRTDYGMSFATPAIGAAVDFRIEIEASAS